MRAVVLYCLAVTFPVAVAADPPILQSQPQAERLYELAAREAQYQSLLGMPDVNVEYGEYGRVHTIKGSTGVFISNASNLKTGDSAESILKKLKPVLIASGSEELVVRLAEVSYEGGRDIYMDQSIDGIRIIDGGLNVRTNSAGEVTVVGSLFVPARNVSSKPELTFQAAKKIIEELLISSGMATASSISLAQQGSLAFWTDKGKEEIPRLIWLIQADYTTPSGAQESVRFGVDAVTGEVRSANREFFGLNRTTYSLHGLTAISSIPSGLQLLWHEGASNPADAQGYSAYNLVVKPRNVWANVGQNYDTLGIVVHWGPPSNANSAYTRLASSGYPYLVFGDPMAAQLDAVAHEYGHGVYRPKFASTPNAFWNEWYAINEFYGDLSAVMTDIAERAGNTQPDTWEITNLVIRDLSNPMSPFVANPADSYRDWYPERRFCCSQASDAYSNSTIFGHALYLIKNGGYHARAGASARHGPIPHIFIQPTVNYATVHRIFANALSDMALTNTPMDAPHLKTATVTVASNLFGSAVANNVANAWTAVGVGYNCSSPPPRPNPTIQPEYCRGRHDITWTGTPGDTYHGQMVASSGIWDLVGQTVIDGPANECHPNVPGPRRFRMQACNACGCSTWTPDVWLYYYSPCL